jgi:hypothetical protein
MKISSSSRIMQYFPLFTHSLFDWRILIFHLESGVYFEPSYAGLNYICFSIFYQLFFGKFVRNYALENLLCDFWGFYFLSHTCDNQKPFTEYYWIKFMENR